MFPSLADVIHNLESRAHKNDQLFQYCPPERLSHLGKLFEGKLFQGNIYSAILAMEAFSQKHIRRGWAKNFLETQYDKLITEQSSQISTISEWVDAMVEDWLTADEYYIIQCSCE